MSIKESETADGSGSADRAITVRISAFEYFDAKSLDLLVSSSKIFSCLTHENYSFDRKQLSQYKSNIKVWDSPH